MYHHSSPSLHLQTILLLLGDGFLEIGFYFFINEFLSNETILKLQSLKLPTHHDDI